MFDSLFQLRAAQTSVRTEVLAGLTTFLTMASILFVNPEILAQAGMDHGAVFVATCLAAAIGSAVMGLLANYLLYIMGLNHITPSASQILIQLAPLLLLIGSVVLFKERLLGLQWFGVLVLIAGMLLFFHLRITDIIATSDSYLAGVALIVGQREGPERSVQRLGARVVDRLQQPVVGDDG